MSSIDLTNELRLAKPRAPEQLRERVMALGERPVSEPRFNFSLPSRYMVRRVAFIAAPAALAVAVGGAVIHGIASSGSPGSPSTRLSSGAEKSLNSTTTANWDSATRGAPVPRAIAKQPLKFGAKSDTGEFAIAPSLNRLQQYQASLSVRVDGLDALSTSTQKAMRIARSLGGYIVSARTDAAKEGSSSLVFRIPIGHVQQALARFSALGTIAAQNIQITDLQNRFNKLVKTIGALRVAIAKVDDQLADTSLSNEARVILEQRRARLTARLEAARTSKARTSHRAALATVSLGLTTHEAAVPAKPQHRGPLGRALHDAGHILAKEASWALYALIVLGPIAVIALLAFLAIRGGRRFADRRLLESS